MRDIAADGMELGGYEVSEGDVNDDLEDFDTPWPTAKSCQAPKPCKPKPCAVPKPCQTPKKPCQSPRPCVSTKPVDTKPMPAPCKKKPQPCVKTSNHTNNTPPVASAPEPTKSESPKVGTSTTSVMNATRGGQQPAVSKLLSNQSALSSPNMTSNVTVAGSELGGLRNGSIDIAAALSLAPSLTKAGNETSTIPLENATAVTNATLTVQNMMVNATLATASETSADGQMSDDDMTATDESDEEPNDDDTQTSNNSADE